MEIVLLIGGGWKTNTLYGIKELDLNQEGGAFSEWFLQNCGANQVIINRQSEKGNIVKEVELSPDTKTKKEPISTPLKRIQENILFRRHKLIKWGKFLLFLFLSLFITALLTRLSYSYKSPVMWSIPFLIVLFYQVIFQKRWWYYTSLGVLLLLGLLYLLVK